MKSNVGKMDKIIRIILAVALFSCFFILEGNARFVALVGFVPLLTSFLSFCPLYRVLGINSCRIKQ